MLKDEYVGKQIADFRIEQRIARGGMATVYRAYQPSVNRYVALKVIPYDQDDTTNQEFRQRFAQEAAVIASLEHIHILPIYAYGIAEGMAYLAMRLLTGGTLNDLLTDGALPLDNAADIFGQVARALAYAHTKGIIHRDLKPSNIMFDDAQNAYLTDFGLAKWQEGSPELTKTGNIVGTPAYMSPEQLRGEAVDHRADIYSMGIILYHMVVGRPPFDTSSSDIISIIYQHLEKMPTSPSSVNPDIPMAVETVILKALSKDPNERYNDVRLMANELDIALGRRVGSTTGTPTPLPRMYVNQQIEGRKTQKRMPLLIGLGVTVLTLFLIGLFLLSQPFSPPAAPERALIQAGEEGVAGDIVPSERQIELAKIALGDGFIAYITCNQTSEYHATQAREMGDFARQFGLSYQVYDSNTDEYQQLTQIERARTDGAKVLIICPLNAELLDAPLKSAQEAGIPIISLSSDIDSYGGVLLVGDEYLLGYKPGEAIGRVVAEERGGEANVIILDYPDLPHIVRRADGLEEGFLKEAPNANIIGRYIGATRELGEASVTQLIEDGIEFDVILSINDAGSFGAINALEKAGIDPESVIIASVDAEQQARQYIQDGYFIRGSVDPGREQFSRTAINAVVKILAGGTLPEMILVPPGDVVTAELLENTPAEDEATGEA